MLENGKISAQQFLILVILFVIGDSILYVPSYLAEHAKQDAWVAGLLGVGEGILLIILYIALGKRFPHRTLTQYSGDILGKWLGKIVSLLFVSFFFVDAAFMLYEMGDFMTTQVLPETPIQFILILFLSVIVMGARLGLETLARASEILFPWFLILFIVLTLFLFPQVEMYNIQPFLEHGGKPILAGNIQFLGFLLECVILMMIFPYVNNVNKAAKAYLWGTVIGVLFLIVITVLSILVLGSDITARHMYPTYSLARKINIGNFLTRIEAVVAGIWFISMFVKTTILYYALVLGLAQTFQLRDYRSLTLPMGMLVVVLSLVFFPNKIYLDTFGSLIWMPYSLIFGLVLPLLLLGIARFRKKG